MKNISIKHFEKLIHKKIPISKKMGINIISYDKNKLIVKAPLKPNKNDKGIGFAGSIYSTAALAGWGFLTLKLNDELIDAKVVMYNCSITYNKPVKDDFTASCSLPDEITWEKFKERLIKKKNNKITLNIKIYSVNNNKNDPEAVMEAVFYAWKNIDII